MSTRKRAYVGCFIILMFASTGAEGGNVFEEVWSFETLVRHSDVVVIATFHAWRTIAFGSEDERATGVYALDEIPPLPKDCVAKEAVFVVKRVVKGKLAGGEFNVLLYVFKDENVNRVGNRRFFPAELAQAPGTRTLMLFLSRSAEGHLFPTTGQSNALDSVYLVEPFEEWRRHNPGSTP